MICWCLTTLKGVKRYDLRKSVHVRERQTEGQEKEEEGQEKKEEGRRRTVVSAYPFLLCRVLCGTLHFI